MDSKYHRLQHFLCVNGGTPDFPRSISVKRHQTSRNVRNWWKELLAKAHKSSVGPAPSSLRGTSATPHGRWEMKVAKFFCFFPKDGLFLKDYFCVFFPIWDEVLK